MNLSAAAFRQWISLPSNNHVVDFYPSDEALIFNLREYVCTGLEKSDTTIVIARPIHIKKLCEEIGKQQSSTELFRNHCIVINAATLLEDFMVDGLPDKKIFFSTVGKLIKNAAKKGQPIRAYGGCMSILWEAGNKDAAMQLEKLWNELAEIYSFSLYCAYPERLFMKNSSEQVGLSSCHAFVTAPQMV
ncbi:MEDS domain-containing protein [Candidatus Saccharibacteria bacterium]|nr:MEDS domain-containing protein [Candidatus Saccharibacteria bacterium]